MDRYVVGSLTSESLEEWLASESWDMRRWAPRGLQHLVESIQSAFITHAQGNLSARDLDAFLRERHEQLHRAADASRPIKEAIDRLLKASRQQRSGIAVSHALQLSVLASV